MKLKIKEKLKKGGKNLKNKRKIKKRGENKIKKKIEKLKKRGENDVRLFLYAFDHMFYRYFFFILLISAFTCNIVLFIIANMCLSFFRM